MDNRSSSRKNTHEMERKIAKAVSWIHGVGQADRLLGDWYGNDVDHEPSHPVPVGHASVPK
jgi:hypothetical protein